MFLSANTDVYLPPVETRSSTFAGDLIFTEAESTRGIAFETVIGESRIAAGVVLDDALVQDDGVDLKMAELDRCWEVTPDQDRASKIEKALFETPRDVKKETNFLSYVARRKLNF